jgi:hypothetical protein
MSGIIEKMQAEIGELKRKVAKLERREEEVLEEAFEAVREYERQISNPTRAEIVKRAKGDVTKLITDMYETDHEGLCKTVKFVVNKEKRTIVALVEEAAWILDRGIAKCAPDDCFNVHIGKAIALRRALGEEVPEEYLNAPAPIGVEVGDVVGFRLDGEIKYSDSVAHIENNNVYYQETGFDSWSRFLGPQDRYQPHVVDDSARYE